MFGLNITRFIPGILRPLAAKASWFLADVAPISSPFGRKRTARAYRGERVLVAGLFRSRSGLGRAAHLLACELERQGRLAGRVDLTGFLHFPADSDGAGFLTPAQGMAGDGQDFIVVVNPPAYLGALRAFDPDWLQDRSIVAHWVWELSVLPRVWKRQAQFADEIWAPSEFVCDALRPAAAAVGVPVRLKPYPVDCDPFSPPLPQRRAEARMSLSIPGDVFCVGMSFSVESGFERKNPLAAIAAFKAACRDPDAILVLRCPDLATHAGFAGQVARAVGGDDRIRIVDRPGILDIAGFYALIDLYLAPFRAEGYGLNLVEAAQSGIPVLATGYGLASDIAARPQVETLGYRLVPVREEKGFYARLPSAEWAEPDADDLARRIAAHLARHGGGEP